RARAPQSRPAPSVAPRQKSPSPVAGRSHAGPARAASLSPVLGAFVLAWFVPGRSLGVVRTGVGCVSGVGFLVRWQTDPRCEPGGCIMRLRGVCVLVVCVPVLAFASSRIEAACVDPATLSPSTVSITRDFDAQERAAEPGVIGIRGTGWFLSP